MSDESKPAYYRPRVLLVEDNDNDVELTKLAFAAVDPAVQLYSVSDGEQCIATLQNSRASGLPHLILLDLQMPRMNGLEVLKALAQDDVLKRIPVIVLTTSDAPEDIDAAYRAGCNSYLRKPLGFNDFLPVIESLTRYWFGTVSLPTIGRRPTNATESGEPIDETK